MNEYLTWEVKDIYRDMRRLKKEHPAHIAVLYARDGIIRANKAKTGLRYDIITRSDLEKFKLYIGLSAYVVEIKLSVVVILSAIML